MGIRETETLLNLKTGAVRRNIIGPDERFRYHDNFTEADADAGWKQVGNYSAGFTEEEIVAGIEQAKAIYFKNGLPNGMEPTTKTVPGANIRIIDVGQSYETLARLMGGTVIKFRPDWFTRAMVDTSATPQGGYKQAWMMKLMRTGSRCQLPRGFFKGIKKPVFVGSRP